MNRKRFLLLGLIVILAGGCTLTPEYTRPAPPVPSNWPAGAAYPESRAGEAAPAAELSWQEFFRDGRLREVVAIALRENRDLRLAALNLERARSFYGIQRAELLPTVDAAGSGRRERIPAELSSGGSAVTAERYDANLGISAWEIDFFGRIRSLKDRALEEFYATDQARRSAQTLLVSEAAHAWLALAAEREHLKLALSTLEAQEAACGLIRKRLELGLSSALDLHRAQGQADAARGEVARSTQRAARLENALRLLAGSTLPPALLPEDLTGVAPPGELSPGVSSERLLLRPDVLAAEHRLRAANANIGAARAAFFPRISLTAAFGTASADLSGLFAAGSGAWSFAPRITMPIFDARTWSAYDVTKVEREISVAQYEKAIQTAFREVADALAVQGTVSRQIAAQQSLVAAAAETHRLADWLYAKGIEGYLSVLDAQRSLYGARQGLVALHLSRLANLVTLYKALGGGI